MSETRRAVRLGDYMHEAAPIRGRPSTYGELINGWVARPVWWALSGWLGADDSDEMGDARLWKACRGAWVLMANVEVRVAAKPHSHTACIDRVCRAARVVL